MAYKCPWPCVSDTAHSAMVQAQVQAVPTKSFAAALAGQNTIDDRPLPTPCIKGDTLSIRIGQEEYNHGVEECKNALRARNRILHVA